MTAHPYEMQQRYKQASKKEKTEMSRELISKVESWGGRFIDLYSDPKNCDGPERWYEVSSKVKLRKASQVLRDINTPQARKEKRAKYNKKKKTEATPPQATRQEATVDDCLEEWALQATAASS